MCNPELFKHIFLASLSAAFLVGLAFAASAYWVYGPVAFFMGAYAMAVAALPAMIFSIPMLRFYRSFSGKIAFPGFLVVGAVAGVVFQFIIGHGIGEGVANNSPTLVGAYAKFGAVAAFGAWSYLSIFGPFRHKTHNNGFNSDAGKARAG